MSHLLSELKIFENTLFKNEIKYYHVWEYDSMIRCALFVTNNDKVYGINIPFKVMTSSYKYAYEEYIDNQEVSRKPIEIKELSDKKIKEFHIRYEFVLALSEESKLYSWGRNHYGQLGRDSDNDIDRNPIEIIYFTNSRSKIKQICVFDNTVMVLLDNGKVVLWGNNEIGLTGKALSKKNFTELFSDWKIIKKPREFNLLKDIEFIYMNYDKYFAIDKNSNVLSWGNNICNELGHKNSSFISKPKISEIFSKLKIITIKSNYNMSYSLLSDGKLYICGKDCESYESISDEIHLFQIKSNNYFTQIDIVKKLKENASSEITIIALSDRNIVYEFKGKELSETEYNSFEEYSVMKYNISYKTFSSTLKNSTIKFTQQIGHGSFGKVYKVFFEKKYYAIKKILIDEVNKGYLDNNNDNNNSELQIMKQLKSDFVVNLFDYWTKQKEEEFSFLYIQMELCDQTLKDIIEDKNSSIPPISNYMIRTEIFRQLLFALNYLHSMTPKVIHRDIKPSNVLIKYYKYHAQLKLCDFGLSKILVKETSNTSNIGTFKYKSPEILTNNYNEKIDIYSLGILVKELFDNFFNNVNVEHVFGSKINNLKFVVENMIYSSPDKRPSAIDILKKKGDWSIEINVKLINLAEQTRKENNYKPLKFLNIQ